MTFSRQLLIFRLLLEQYFESAQVEGRACFQKSPRIFRPRRLVEIDSEEPACFVREHGIDADGEIAIRPAIRISTKKVVPDRIIRNREELPILTVGTFHLLQAVGLQVQWDLRLSDEIT